MRVLLIEDDSATAQSIELMLKSESFNVYTTDLGEEGVDLGKLYDYDIIVLDLQLPDMSGFEVLKTLRLAKVQTPVLILSGNAIVEAKVKALGFGADGSSRRPLGLVVVGGLVVSQFITLYVTPAIYLSLEEFQKNVLDRTSFFRSVRSAPATAEGAQG